LRACDERQLCSMRYLVTGTPSADGPFPHPRSPIQNPHQYPSNLRWDGAIRPHPNRGLDGDFFPRRRWLLCGGPRSVGGGLLSFARRHRIKSWCREERMGRVPPDGLASIAIVSSDAYPKDAERLTRCDNDPMNPPFVGACWGPICRNEQPDMSRIRCALSQGSLATEACRAAAGAG